MSTAFAATARAYRAAIRKHEFSEPQWRIVDVILFYSFERPSPRYKALVPKQAIFGLLCGKMSKGKISEELSWLETQQVLERESVEVIVSSQRRMWTAYGLLTPAGWRVPWRVRESTVLQNLEVWLELLDVEQGELLAPPTSLNDLLREDFVERAGAGASHSPFNEEQSRVEGFRPGSPGGNFRSVESKERAPQNRAPMVPSQGTSVEPQLAAVTHSPPEVPPGGTSALRVPQGGTSPVPLEGTLHTSNRSTRFEKDSSFTRLEYTEAPPVPPGGTAWLSDGYVRDKLARKPNLSRELIDGKSFDGRSSLLGRQFGQLWKKYPDEARELLGVAIEKNNPNAWLNTAVRVSLGLQKIPMPAGGDWRPGQ